MNFCITWFKRMRRHAKSISLKMGFVNLNTLVSATIGSVFRIGQGKGEEKLTAIESKKNLMSAWKKTILRARVKRNEVCLKTMYVIFYAKFSLGIYSKSESASATTKRKEKTCVNLLECLETRSLIVTMTSVSWKT